MSEDSLRASDADREATVALLQSAFTEGRLDLSELDERTAAAYAAKTLRELAELTRDLPQTSGSTTAVPQPQSSPPLEGVQRQQHTDVRRWMQFGLPPVIVISFVVWLVIGLTDHWVHPWWIWIVVAWLFGGPGRRRRHIDRRRRDRYGDDDDDDEPPSVGR